MHNKSTTACFQHWHLQALLSRNKKVDKFTMRDIGFYPAQAPLVWPKNGSSVLMFKQNLNFCVWGREISAVAESNFQSAVPFPLETNEFESAVESEKCFLSPLHHLCENASDKTSSQVNTKHRDRHPWRKSPSSLKAVSQYSPDIPREPPLHMRHPRQ